MCVWLRVGAEKDTDPRRQTIAIAVLIAILFPTISMSDDLLAIQNAVEADSYLRRDNLLPSNTYPVQPILAVIATTFFLGLGFGSSRFSAPTLLPNLQLSRLEIGAIENRPPPRA